MLELNGVEYELQQFHFHGLSEHTFEGQSQDMELHFVHQNAEGVNAVVGVLMVAARRVARSHPSSPHCPTTSM